MVCSRVLFDSNESDREKIQIKFLQQQQQQQQTNYRKSWKPLNFSPLNPYHLMRRIVKIKNYCTHIHIKMFVLSLTLFFYPLDGCCVWRRWSLKNCVPFPTLITHTQNSQSFHMCCSRLVFLKQKIPVFCFSEIKTAKIFFKYFLWWDFISFKVLEVK